MKLKGKQSDPEQKEGEGICRSFCPSDKGESREPKWRSQGCQQLASTPNPPSFAARASELHILQCWELTWNCSYVQVDFSWKNDAWSFAVFPGWCCQWVLTRSRNSCRPPRDFTHRPRCLPQLCFTPAQQRLWGVSGAPHVPSAENHLNNGF